jgi:hypothetical protein
MNNLPNAGDLTGVFFIGFVWNIASQSATILAIVPDP